MSRGNGHKKTIKLSYKLIFYIMISFVIMIGIVSYFRINREQNFVKHQFEDTSFRITEIFGNKLSYVKEYGSDLEIENLLKSILNYKDILSVELLDIDQQRIYFDEKKFELTEKKEIIYFDYNFNETQNIASHIKLGFTNYYIQGRLNDIEIKYCIENIVILIVLFIVISVLVNKIIKPIKILEDEVDNISNGNYNIAVEMKTNDEIGRLGSKIEVMRHKILESQEELSETNRNLESIVEERTSQLIKTNQYLEETLANIEEVQAELIVKNNELEDALEELQDTRLELVQSAKLNLASEVVAGVAHEINTPLGIALTVSTYLSNETNLIIEKYKASKVSKSDFTKYLNTMEESAKTLEYNIYRATDLVANFKEVAVDQTGKVKRKYELREYLDKILTSLYPKFKRTNHHIENNIPENISIDGYPGAFSQLITNLVMNTLVHGFEEMDEGTIEIKAEELKNTIIITYKDNGNGMSKEVLERIFDPFFTTKKESGGSGLGMSIVYNLVTKIMGGSLKCNSELGMGTEFIIEMPKIQD